MPVRAVLAVSLLACAPAALAADWQPSGELGFVATRGNADTSTFNGRLALKREDDGALHEFGASALHGEADGELKAKRWELAASSGRKLSERSYVAGSVRWEDDAFARHDHRAVTAASYGRVALDADGTSLKFEVGPGFRHAALADGTREDAGVVRGKSDFRHRVTPSTELFNTVLVEGAGGDAFARGDVGVQVAINASVALKAGLQLRHDTRAKGGFAETDTLTTVNLVWSPKR